MLRTIRASMDPCPCFYNLFLQLKVIVHLSFLLEFNHEKLIFVAL
jgi:hypothetical protein